MRSPSFPTTSHLRFVGRSGLVSLACFILLIATLQVQAITAYADAASVVDSGFHHTSHEIRLEGSVVVKLSPGDTMLVIEDAPKDAHFKVKSQNAGIWSEAVEVENHGDEGPDEAPRGEGSGNDPTRANIGPIWLGNNAEAVEISPSVPDKFTVTTLRPAATAEVERTRVNGARLTAGQPDIKLRSSWANEGWSYSSPDCDDGPELAPEAKAVVIHHTVSTNSYSRGQVDDILRGMYHFHVNINKWCDVGYNFIVDKYGTIWEGRSGGIDRAVVGGHAKGFNTDTTGVALLGQHQQDASPAAASPTAASKAAIAKLAAWKLSLSGVKPTDRVSLTNRSTSGAQKLASEADHKLPSILAHQDLVYTSCPGSLTMPFIRELASLAGKLAPGSTGNQKYVQALSKTFDGRGLRDDEVPYWVRLTERDGYQSVAQMFVLSTSNTGSVVNNVYSAALGRRADAQGREHWVKKIQAGYRYEDLAAALYGSREISVRKPRDSEYITHLYRYVLGRDPDQAGLNSWVRKLQSGRFTRSQAARLFVRSTEGRQQRVENLFQTVLKRPPSQANLQYWTGYLWGGDDFTMSAKLAASDEFRNKA